MSKMKNSLGVRGPNQKQARRGVKAATCDKWIAENDAELSMSVWLKYERQKGNSTYVESIRCSLSIQH